MQERIHPLTFEPVFRDYVWGGRSLATLFARKLPPGIVAESWEISGHPSSPTRVDNGAWRGTLLPDVLAELGSDLVGTNSADVVAWERFPLLVKLLDANRNLSLQVHPDDAYASQHQSGDPGKTEMWYILDAQPGSQLVYGLAQGVTRESFRSAIASNTLETQLHRVSIASGDCIFVPPGTVHALLAGVVVAEIQQTSDATFRVYDWGRLGADGRSRPLHIEEALQVIDFGQPPTGKVEPQIVQDSDGVKRARLADCRHFTVERVDLAPGSEFQGLCGGSTFEIWGCIKGYSQIHWSGEPVSLRAIRFALLPAVLGHYALQAGEASSLLRAYVRKPG
ncbi:MAG TPA: type I phosphomannose isomerase catalytic subunit [Anaerolineae bacterium]|nr:type I phosphomannose isomerase catalytic subunit [Anaerolineae bacterium]